MSAGYDDDRRGDRYDDDRPDGRYDDRDRPARGTAAAKARVTVPAVLLIVTGALGLVLAVRNTIAIPDLGPELDKQQVVQEEKVDANADLTDAQKKDQKELVAKFIGVFKQVLPPAFVVNLVAAAVVLAGGVQMLRLSGRGLPMLASVLAMIPGVNCVCCVLGLPAGIWALVVLMNPEVKAAFAARRRTTDGYNDV